MLACTANSNSGTTFGMEGSPTAARTRRCSARPCSGSGPASPIALAATTRTSTYMWFVPFNNFWDQGPQGGVRRLLFMQACKGLPGHHAIGGSTAAG